MNLEEIKIKFPEFTGKANHAFKDIANQKFNKLLALYRYELNSDGKAQWVCLCDCGEITLATGKQLRTDNKKSCGCLKKDMMIKMNTDRCGEVFGRTFGKLTPLYENGFINKPNGKRVRLIRCKCECDNEIDVQVQYLLSGDTSSCGCVRSTGEYSITKYLISRNINFQKEYIFNDLKIKLPLRFDFAILNSSKLVVGLIEFNGKQHYDKSNGFYNENIVLSDKMKKEYCDKNNIPLLVIKYNEDVIEKINSFINYLKEDTCEYI